ncbi:putative gag protein [Cucumis melo var. makuwa]|uniref:Gag protein n=1 Tax=Cucumis melo var. makuwa TaxID=1194695 RepID=A0A5A7V9L3_CUCMM|nr:putative gag protein [Cucumis melo var. makuwa]
MKIKIAKLSSKFHPLVYGECEGILEMGKEEDVFDCNTFSDNKKMRLAIVEFISHTENWYQDFKFERKRKEEELKDAMRKRYALKHYEIDLKTKLQALR